ncbi:hypothetical protein Tco_1439185 [Tanacetum coccineum]
MFDKAFKRVNTFEDFRTKLVEGKEKRAGAELIQENAKKQKVDDDKETAELKHCLEIIRDEEEELMLFFWLLSLQGFGGKGMEAANGYRSVGMESCILTPAEYILDDAVFATI